MIESHGDTNEVQRAENQRDGHIVDHLVMDSQVVKAYLKGIGTATVGKIAENTGIHVNRVNKIVKEHDEICYSAEAPGYYVDRPFRRPERLEFWRLNALGIAELYRLCTVDEAENMAGQLATDIVKGWEKDDIYLSNEEIMPILDELYERAPEPLLCASTDLSDNGSARIYLNDTFRPREK